MNDVQASVDQPAGLLRRLGAMVSDALVVLGLLVLSSFFMVPPLLSALGNKKALVPSEVGWFWSVLYLALMVAIWAAYFVILWSRSGQTVGMRAWRLRLVTTDGQLVSRRQALWRFVLAALAWLPAVLMLALAEVQHSMLLKKVGFYCLLLGALGLLSMYWRASRQSWHDFIANQKIVLLQKL